MILSSNWDAAMGAFFLLLQPMLEELSALTIPFPACYTAGNRSGECRTVF